MAGKKTFQLGHSSCFWRKVVSSLFQYIFNSLVLNFQYFSTLTLSSLSRFFLTFLEFFMLQQTFTLYRCFPHFYSLKCVTFYSWAWVRWFTFLVVRGVSSSRPLIDWLLNQFTYCYQLFPYASKSPHLLARTFGDYSWLFVASPKQCLPALLFEFFGSFTLSPWYLWSPPRTFSAVRAHPGADCGSCDVG